MAGEEKLPFEEQAALRELEKLQVAIEESRGRRKRANDAFDQFVKSFDESRRPRQPAPETPPPVVEPPVDRPPIPAALAPLPSGRRNSPLPVALAVAAIAVLALIVMWYSSGPARPAAVDTRAQPAPAPAPALPTAATSGNEAPPPAELRTIRRVWIRVTVDGAKVMEREVEAAARIPLQAASEIVIRTGDAGAVRVSIAGTDQGPLGADGQVATKRFALR